MSPNGRPPLPIERKQKLGTLRPGRLPAAGLTEVSRLPITEEIPAPPGHLQAKGRAFWGRSFQSAPWLWQDIDLTLVEMTAETLDEREQLRGLIDGQPDNTRLRAALRAVDKQLVSNLSLLGFTPSDRSRLGLVEAKTKTWLQEAMERRHYRDLSEE